MQKGEKFKLTELNKFQGNSIVSSKILENSAGGVTIFSFDKGQRLSEHSAPFDAIVQIISGKGEISIAGKPHQLSSGEAIIMPANVPHAVRANEQFQMMLIMIKGN